MFEALFKDEKSQKYWEIQSTFGALKKNAQRVKVGKGYSFLQKQYTLLREKLISLDSSATDYIPTLNEAKMEQALDFMEVYLNSRMLPTYSSVIDWFMKAGLVSAKGSFNLLMPILTRLKLSQNWAIAAAALCSLEVLVNKKLRGCNLSVGGNFKERVKRLGKYAEQKKIQLPDLLVGGFWDARQKVVHEGREPTSEDIKIIVGYIMKYANEMDKLI